MARILYSLAQDGRGHASRGYEIIRRLANQGHQVHVFTGGDTYEPLDKAIQGMKNVSLRRLLGFRQAYNPKGNIDYGKTATMNFQSIIFGELIIKRIGKLIEKYHFDFAISDFEPFVPRAAKKEGLRFITVDNQHRIMFEKSGFGRIRAKHIPGFLVTEGLIRSYHPFGSKCIIASVFKPELKRKKIGATDIISLGPIVRKEVEELKNKTSKMSKDNFVLAYVKHPLEKAILQIIKEVNARFVIYVQNPDDFQKDKSLHNNTLKNIHFKKHSSTGFAQDLAKCKAVVASAGEQLMSESLYLGKPIFLMPEGGTFEQVLNGYAVRKAGVGDYMDISSVKPEHIDAFLKKLSFYEMNISNMQINNSIGQVMRIVNSELAKAVKEIVGVSNKI